MSERTARPDLLASVLPTVLQRVDPDRQLRAYAVWNFWDEEVGDAIARRAQPARFRNGILFIAVASHAWMQELQFMKEEIRDKLNARLGEPLIKDIFFVSGTVAKSAPTPLPAPPPNPEPVVEDVVVPPLPSAGDARLDAAFASLWRAHVRRQARNKG